MCLKKQLLDDPETSAQRLGRGFGQQVYPPGDNTVLGCTQVCIYFQSPEGQKRIFQVNSHVAREESERASGLRKGRRLRKGGVVGHSPQP